MFRAISFELVAEPVLLEQSDDVLSTNQGLLLMGALFALVGLVIVYTSANTGFGRARQLLNLKSVSEGVVDAGEPVDLAGEIAAIDGTVTGPLTDDECVLYEELDQERRREFKYDLEERRRMRRSSLQTKDEDEIDRKVTRWVTTDRDTSSVPFAVETPIGPVEIDDEDAAEADLDIPTQHVRKASIIHRLLHSTPVVSNLGRIFGSVNPNRRIERHLSPGDSVHVLGAAIESTDEGLVATPSPEGGSTVITTKSARRHAIGNLLRGIFVSIPGVLVTFLGVALLAGGVYLTI